MKRREEEPEPKQPRPRPRSASSGVTFSSQSRLLGSPTGAGTLLPPPTSPRQANPMRTPRSMTPLRPVDLGLSAADVGARRHRVSASLGPFEQCGTGPIHARGPVSPSSPVLSAARLSPQLFAARSRSNSIPESAKLTFGPAVGAVVVEDDDSDDEDLASEAVYDWCALDTAEGLTQGTASGGNTRGVGSTCPSPPSVVILGAAPPLTSAAAAPQAERPSYRPPAITIGSPTRALGRATQPSPLDATEAISRSPSKGIMDSTGQRIIAAATPRAPPPTPDTISSAGSHWRSDSSWSLGSTVTLDGGGDFGSSVSVKDTHLVVRRKASLPVAEQQPVSGACFRQHSLINQYMLLDLLGTGSYGEVRLCQDTTTEELFAVKIVKKDSVVRCTPPAPVEPSASFDSSARLDPSTPPPLTPRSRYQQQYEQLQTEIAVMKRLSHPNVLRLVEVLDDPKSSKIYLVLEYMKRGDLLRVLHGEPKSSTCEPLGDHETWALVRQVAAGLHYLHQQGVVHGDIKPQNLLVADDGTVKLADFGLAKIVRGDGERLLGSGGTPAFQAPEVCAGERYDGHAADIWSLGATIFMVRFGRPPFVADGVLDLFNQIIHEPVVFPADVGMCAGLHRLLEGVLQKEPSQRWTVAQIVADPWLQQEWGATVAAEGPTVRIDPTSAAGSPLPPPQQRNMVCPGHSVSRCAFDPVLEAGGGGACS